MSNPTVLLYFRSTKHTGILDQELPDVGVGSIETSCCGAAQFFLQADGDEKILDVKYRVKGDPVIFACAAFIAEQCVGKTLTAAFQLSEQQVAGVLNLKPKEVRKANTPLKALRRAVATCQTKLRRYYIDV